MANDLEKEAAARSSLRFVKDGQVVGLGTGSTAAYFIQLLGERVKNGLQIRGIPSSNRSREQAASLGIPLTTLDECQQIDVTVDGADEVDPQLRLIKGGGGALLHEKIVASATRQLVIVVDASKRVPVLGKFPLPVEVMKFAKALVKEKDRGAWARRLNCGVTSMVSHSLPTKTITYLIATSDRFRMPTAWPTLSDMPGIVEHGLFIGMASVVLVANGSEVIELRR